MKTQMFYQDGAWMARDAKPFRYNYVPYIPFHPKRITKVMQLGLTPNEARRKQNKLMLRRLSISASNTCSPE